MKRKNYLVENLTTEEVKYIRGIIWKVCRECVRANYKRNKIESKSIYDDNIKEDIFIINDEYVFFNDLLIKKYFKNKIKIRPLTSKEQMEIVYLLNNIAAESDLNIYIGQLTFKEKLIVFLYYIAELKINEISILLQISRQAVYYRYKCISAKIKIVKGLINNE